MRTMQYTSGSIFETDAEAIINPVNTQGVMGAGLAKQFADRFPAIVEPYKRACFDGRLKPGGAHVIRVNRSTGERDAQGDLWIINLATKDHWRDPSRMEWIETGLAKLGPALKRYGIQSVALPKIGSGLGGLEWPEVRASMVRHLSSHAEKGLRVIVYGDGPDPIERQENAAARAAQTGTSPAAADQTAVSGDTSAAPRETFTFFWQGPLSQWHPTDFTDQGIRFSHAEQYMMWRKARLFKDEAVAEKILAADHPKEHKALGRQVHGFDEKVWAEHRANIVRDATRLRLAQDTGFREALLATKGTTCVEASPYDRIWGIGLPANDARAQDRTKWRGQNLLGQILTEERDAYLRQQGVGARSSSEPASFVAGVTNLKLIRRNPREPLPADVVDISRYSRLRGPNGEKLGNPFVMTTAGGKDGTREEVIAKFAAHFEKMLGNPGFPDWLAKNLAGKRLGCFCAPHACHGDVIKAATDARLAGNDPVSAIQHFKTVSREPHAHLPRDTSAAAPVSTAAVTAAATPGTASSRAADQRSIDVPEFQGEYRCFSNMYRAPVEWGDAVTPKRIWPCNELPYVLAKTTDPAARAGVVQAYDQAEAQKPGSGPYAIKKAGRNLSLRADWDARKFEVMRDLVSDKFRRNIKLGDVLLATGSGHIQEGNRWGDTVWGVALQDMPNRNIKAGDGRNELGKILMETRSALARERGVQLPGEKALSEAYAGIGARATPPAVLKKMEQVANQLARNGLILRSGGANGADTAFEVGHTQVKGAEGKEIYLPWKGFNGRGSDAITSIHPDAFKITAQIHPAWERCSQSHKKLHARNAHQVLGRKLNDPVRAVVCWTENGETKGGTATAIRLAQKKGCPVINLGAPRWRDKTVDEIVQAVLRPELARETPSASRESKAHRHDARAEARPSNRGRAPQSAAAELANSIF